MLRKLTREINEPYLFIRLCFLILLPVSANLMSSKDLAWAFDLTNDSRVCFRFAENGIYEPAFEPYPNFCHGWICPESQLLLVNKIRIIKLMNAFRNYVAKNISNMNLLAWHWTLEQEALRASKRCNRRYLEKYEELRHIEGLGPSLRCENGCLYKIMTQNPSQKLFVTVLFDLLLNNSLQDFDSDGKFRRGNAMFVGCSLNIRNTITENDVYEDIYNFVCVFCTTEPEMMTIYKKTANDSDCPLMYTRGVNPNYPELCAGNQFPNIYMCLPYNACPMEKPSDPRYWKRTPGTAIELAMFETDTDPIILSRGEHVGPYNDEGNPSYYNMTYSINNAAHYWKLYPRYPLIPKHAYDYSPQQMNKFSDILSHLTEGRYEVRKPVLSEPAVVYIPDEALEKTQDAWCCFQILSLSLIPTCVLAVLIYYTIRNL